MNQIAKAIIYLTLICCLCALNGCDDATEVSRVLLSTQEKHIFPYSKGQKIEFAHSKGYQFKLVVSDVYFNFHRYYELPSECWFCRNTGNYVLFEMKHLRLVSDYPKLVIEIDYGAISYPFVENGDSTLSTNGKPLKDKIDKYLGITVNGFNTYDTTYDNNLNYNCSEKGIKCYDSIVINEKTYYNVVELDAYYYDDSIYSSVKSVLYNEKGLLQLKLSKDESYSIN